MKHLALRLLTIVALASTVALGGCSSTQWRSFQNDVSTGWSVLTGKTSVQVTASTVSIAGSAFDIAQAGATAYLGYCKQNPSQSVCAPGNVSTVVKSGYSGRVARNRLKACVKAGNCGTGANDDFTALTAATGTIKGITALWQGN